MATESSANPVNGNYGAQQSYQHTDSSNSAARAANGANGGNSAAAANGHDTSGAAESKSGVPKDEVGWYFVEQYYTTLSRNPEKLHLFYNKRSQFLSGVEAEKVPVSVGQRAINERIKELEIQDCKVRVSNVDSQESFNNLVVQVIGEMSNKAAAHRKFVQTFVLAEQPNGYYVLNDIFRYLNEEEEEEMEEQTVQAPEVSEVAVPESEPRTLTSSDDPALQQQDVDVVTKKLEEDVPKVKTDEPIAAAISINGKSGSEAAGDDEVSTTSDPMDPTDVDSVTVPKDETQPTAQVQTVPAEKPIDPEPTPVASPPKPTTATPAPSTASIPTPAPKPAAPKTWANLVASRAPSTTASVPATMSSTSPAPPQTKPSQPQSNTIAASAPSAAQDTASQAQQGPGAGWQTAGQDNTRKQARQQSNSVSSGAAERGNILGYVKNVTEKVDAAELKTVLNQYGKLEYFDVSRQKNCAFVEFATLEGYSAAVAANPHLIGGEQIYVEERRPRPTAYGGGFNGRGGMRGGRGGPDGRTPSQGRGGFPKDGGRGGFAPRGRGGSLTPRGRGMLQAA